MSTAEPTIATSPRGAARAGIAVRFAGITRRFPGVIALDDVSFEIAAGSCHAICGENGAGKSTLSQVLAGLQEPDAGELLIDGTPVRFMSPHDALAAGIAMVPQELLFCGNLSVAENMFLGTLPSRAGIVDRAALRTQAAALLATIGANVDPGREMSSLSIAQQQLVQIATAVGRQARLIIFDEPTSSLTATETANLYTLIGDLRTRGVTVVYISHRMPEIFHLSDMVTVLRDGRHVSTDPTAQLDERMLVQRMIGREMEVASHADHARGRGDAVLVAESLASPGRFEDISFTLHAGEVLGLAGLVGAGRTEIANALFGLDRDVTGAVRVRGEPVRIRSPREAMSLGIGLVPEDRKRLGLVLSLLARENATLPVIGELATLGWIAGARERAVAHESMRRVRLRDGVAEVPTVTLSGGNQQKVVLARWLTAGSTILLLDEPTRGVDVGAKEELHAWIAGMAAAGAAILLISSELPELLALSDRILVLREGCIMGEVARGAATQEAVMRLMAGITDG